MKLSLIIPCYNEEGNILPLFRAVNDAFEGRVSDYEFVFVNDGSQDRTGAVLRQLTEETCVPVTVVSFSRNFGKEAAILAGLRAASGGLLSLIDGDLQQNPALVADMADYLDAHPECDCVTAVQESRNEKPTMVFFKKSFYAIINAMTDIHFEPNASDFRTFRRSVADVICGLPEHQRFSKGIFAWIGFNTHYIPYSAEERLSGTSKWSFWKLFRYATDGILAYTVKPLRIAGVLGASSMAASLGACALALRKDDKHTRENGLLAALILLMGGLQLTATGILGEYAGRIYLEGKNRPNYIVKETFTNQNDESS